MYYRIIKIISVFITLQILGSSMAYAVRRAPSEKGDETIITRNTKIGGFLGPVVKFNRLNEKFAVLVGGRGGVIFNRSFVIGLEGYGLVNEIKVNKTDYYPIDLGYGGLFLGYVNSSHKLVHFSIHSLIGVGGLRYRTCFYNDWYDDTFDDVFFVFEPGLDMMLNITDYFRIGIGGTYRFAHGVTFDELISNDISGPAGSLIFKFGWF